MSSDLDRLREIVRGLGSVAVAYSGGVDSAVLLAVAVRELGDQAVGVLAISPSIPAEEREAARATAREIGASLVEVDGREMDRPGYVENSPERCYHCKSDLFDRVAEVAERLGLATIAYGANLDDAGDFRPGMRAAGERRVRAPLLEAGFAKADVRALARAMDLTVWDKPAAPCLSSRIPYGEPVTEDALARIAAAERSMRALGFRVFRVRHHGGLARVEVATHEMGRLSDPSLRTEVSRCLKEAGYTWVALDLDGFKSGGLNSALNTPRPAGR